MLNLILNLHSISIAKLHKISCGLHIFFCVFESDICTNICFETLEKSNPPTASEKIEVQKGLDWPHQSSNNHFSFMQMTGKAIDID